MKRIILIILTMILLLGVGYFVIEMYGFADGVRQDAIKNEKWKNENSKIYFIDLPAGLDTISFEANITLDTEKRIHKVKFPNGGTETNVFIYDSTFLKHLQNTIVDIEPLTQGDFSKDEEVLLDITSLKKGKYYVHYLSCGLGGIFPLVIK